MPDYKTMVKGTGDENDRRDYSNVNESTPTQNKQPGLKHQKSIGGIQVNQKHLKKCQDLLKTIKASTHWTQVCTASAISD